jgi:hypothetical protein
LFAADSQIRKYAFTGNNVRVNQGFAHYFQKCQNVPFSDTNILEYLSYPVGGRIMVLTSRFLQ